MSRVLHRSVLRILAITAAILFGAGQLAFAQAQVRVIKDHSIIWNLGMPLPITTVRAGTELEVIGREGEFYVVRVPGTGGRSGETGRIAVSQVEVIAGTPPTQPAPPESRRGQDSPTPEQTRVSGSAEHGIGFYGFGEGGMTAWLANETFSAVFGNSRAPIFGVGGQIRVNGQLVIEGAVERFKETGQRVFVSGDEVFKLGIRDTVRIIPISVTASYRHRAGSAAYYGGGGVGQYFYKEDSDFAQPAENVNQRFTSYHVVAGVEFGAIGTVLKTAFEVQFTSVPDAIGTTGASAAFGEHNLGGLQLRVKILAGK